ncbi:Methyl-accepting chemotaxis protein [Candidatus Rhodobacter oscarellae]|uniref:Methyl-accepting chemotaxis protein n=1 Tax=Candidatus Rhodobacter oscarellae TaxID=1675527 RepID=A0A0J9E302_9RHOB|nr:type IV pili methyl-accepting chemotaxis transducer N-terminal domain-containing protein [Candidatus Rhodobacter lobularis]KMW57087.1 Methyl-accepting chemotaxis protein [Candidatus Rhodobacter lobularis]
MDDGTRLDAKRKINIAGRQRMLSQRMTRAACFVAIGVAADQSEKIMRAAMAEFESARQSIRFGGGDMELMPEQSAPVLKELTEVDRLWPVVNRAILDVTEKGADVSDLAALSVDLLVQANDVVQALEVAYQDALEMPELARLINVSGRQRMLTQRATKEMCLIAAGADKDAMGAALGKTVSLFDRSLEGLRFGSQELDLIGAPTAELEFQLEHVAELWIPLQAIFLRVADGAAPTEAELLHVFDSIDQVLREANAAVQMYQAL